MQAYTCVHLYTKDRGNGDQRWEGPCIDSVYDMKEEFWKRISGGAAFGRRRSKQFIQRRKKSIGAKNSSGIYRSPQEGAVMVSARVRVRERGRNRQASNFEWQKEVQSAPGEVQAQHDPGLVERERNWRATSDSLLSCKRQLIFSACSGS